MDSKTAFARGFLHGITGAGLFHRLRCPGLSSEFAESQPVETATSDEYSLYMRFREEFRTRLKDRAPQHDAAAPQKDDQQENDAREAREHSHAAHH